MSLSMNESSPATYAIECDKVDLSYPSRSARIDVLKHVTLRVDYGERVAVVAPSGAGKSSLLYCLAGLLRPDDGTVHMMGRSLSKLGEPQRAALRLHGIGFVFQFFNLLSHVSALDNVALPLRLVGQSKRTARSKAARLLESVGLSHRMAHHPAKLSGGEQQRVAVARAVVNSPAIVLADEPTGNLDDDSGRRVADLLFSLENSPALVVVTHDRELANRADRILELRSGHLSELSTGGGPPSTA